MKKILILCNSCIGLYKFRKELIEKLVEEKYEVYISLSFDDFSILEKLRAYNVELIEVSINRRGKNIWQELILLKEYLCIIKKIKPDIILTYTIKPNLYGGLISRILKIPCIINITGLGTLFQTNSLLSQFIIYIYRIALKNAKKIFFQNSENMIFFLKNKIVSIDKVRLINGSGVNLKKFQCELKGKKKQFYFIFIGRIMKEKGIDEYLEVARKLKKKYNNKLEFQILGSYEEEEYRVKIEKMVEEGFVKYLGISDDVRVELKEVHCLVNPSWHEGMSNVLLEAGAMKRFLIASDIPGCKEIVINNKTGFTFEKKNINELEAKIEKFINLSEEEYEQYLTSSYKYIKNNFDRKMIIKEYIKIINS